MKRLITVIVMLAGILGGEFSTVAWSAELKVIQTQKTKDAVVALKSESGLLVPGKNSFVLEFTSPSGQPLDVGKVALSTSMAMLGMAPMVEGATLSPDKAPGRYMRDFLKQNQDLNRTMRSHLIGLESDGVWDNDF